MEMEFTKSHYAIRLELPNTVTVSQCQELLYSILQHRIVKDAMFVIENPEKESRFSLRTKQIIAVEKDLNDATPT